MVAALLLLILAAQAPRAAHADHQPTQAGLFASAADDTIHLEAFLLPGPLLRVIVTDRAGQPLSAENLRALNIRIVANGNEQPMAISTDGLRVEHQLARAFAAPMTVTVGLTATAASGLVISFTFSQLNDGDAETFIIPPTIVPATRAGILEMLKTESAESQAILDGSPSHGVYIAVTRVRDLALALEAYLAELTLADRTRATTAIREAVRTSWLLHTAADNGVPSQTRLGVMQMREAIEELLSAFGVTTRGAA